ncbi:MAG: hypothetical protein MSG64_17160 [Pyrinomonadaceae bacterium MAG19_C2-C3]|nr:hypothetical protein [Pyrinomonadaceae bacterium MAG19_C2-C3]
MTWQEEWQQTLEAALWRETPESPIFPSKFTLEFFAQKKLEWEKAAAKDHGNVIRQTERERMIKIGQYLNNNSIEKAVKAERERVIEALKPGRFSLYPQGLEYYKGYYGACLELREKIAKLNESD